MTEETQAQNRELMEMLLDQQQDGHNKSASDAGTGMIRRRIREEGRARLIIPPHTITDADLDRVATHDRPVRIEEMEPLSPGSISIPFGTAAQSAPFYGDKFTCMFHEITTREYYKDVNELRTYRGDIRQLITDNALRDVQTEEDDNFISAVDLVAGPSNGVGAAGVQQNFELTGGFTRANYLEATNKLEDQNLNNGCFLMNRRTFKQWAKFTRDEIGGDLAQDFFTKGMSALGSAEVFGIRHITTIKRDIVPDNVIYIFGEPNYLGRFYDLQPLTLFVERKKNTIKFSARETLSITIANVLAVARVKFVA